MPAVKKVSSVLPVSPPRTRTALENFSNSPRANRPQPPATIFAARKANPPEETIEEESYLPTPQTADRNTASLDHPSSSNIQTTVLASSKLPAVGGGKNTYKPLVPRLRADASATSIATASLLTGSQEASAQAQVQVW